MFTMSQESAISPALTTQQSLAMMFPQKMTSVGSEMDLVGYSAFFPPVPALLDDVRVLGILVRIKVIDQQYVGTYGLVSRTTRRLSGTQCAERDLPFGGEFILGP